MPTLYNAILRRLVAARAAARPKVSQETLAARMNVRQSTVSAWETGTNEMGLDAMAAYAGALGMDLRVDLVPAGSPTRAEQLGAAVAGLSEERYQEVRRMVDAALKASADTRFMVVGLLEAAVQGRGGPEE